MAEDTGVAQARELLSALNEHVEDITRKIDNIEKRCRASVRGATLDRKHRNELRKDLYEAYRHIDRIHRRFPVTRPERQA